MIYILLTVISAGIDVFIVWYIINQIGLNNWIKNLPYNRGEQITLLAFIILLILVFVFGRSSYISF